MLWRCMNSLAKLLLDSNCAAACVGPKIFIPRRVNSSTTPSDSGSSGPTTVRSASIWWAVATSVSMDLVSPGTHVASSQIPPLPGRQNTSDTRCDCRSFHTSACSRPPPPMTRTFIVRHSRVGVGDDDVKPKQIEEVRGQIAEVKTKPTRFWFSLKAPRRLDLCNLTSDLCNLLVNCA